jgi:hypothetical protein
LRTTAHPQALWLPIILLAAWMFHPALTPAHVEGFSASIVSIALHLNTGHLADYDRLFPANLEYFSLSRLGTILFMSALTGELGMSGEWAMRLTTWAGLAALATSSFLLVRHWTHASSKAAVLALLLIPGVAESSFFYNDTIFAAALGVTALAVIELSSGLAAVAVSGVLLGAAIVARLDAVLLAPAVLLIGYDRYGVGRAFWVRGVVFALGVLVPVISIPARLGVDILDVYATTKYALVLWGDPIRLVQHAREASFFIGIPAGVLIALGCLGLVRTRDHPRLLLFAGVPALFNLVAFGKIWTSRQLLPMTPFFAALVIVGWQHVATETSDAESRRVLKWTVLALCCLAWVAPIVLVRVSDGPRAPYGRLWTPTLWRRWQDAANGNQSEILKLVEHPEVASTAFITDTWDADRYLHLAFQEAGYRLIVSAAAARPCERTAETFARGDRTVLHIRLHQPFFRNSTQLAAARLQTYGIPCVETWRPSRLIRLAPLEQIDWSIQDSARADLLALRARAVSTILASHYSPQLAYEVRPSELPPLVDTYLREAQGEGYRFTDQHTSAAALGAAERMMAARIWRSPPAMP